MSFDPYYQWLGIPPDEQPADHYRLLGIRRFEHDANVIETAAERHLLLLKTRQNGPHSRLTQQLMNEVTSARLCLLDAREKADYDARLHQRIDSETPVQRIDSETPARRIDSETPVQRIDRETPARGSTGAVTFTVPEDVPVLDPLWPEALPSASASSPLHPKTPLKAPLKGRRDKSEQSGATHFLPAGSLLVLSGAAMTVLFLLAVLWLFGVSDEDGRSAASTDADRVAKSDGKGRSSVPIPSRSAPDTRPPQPPALIVQPSNPQDAGSDPQRIDSTRAVTAQPGTGSPVSGDRPPSEYMRDMGPGGSTRSADLPDNEGGPSYDLGPPPGGGHPQGVRYDPSTGRRFPESPSRPRAPLPSASPDSLPIEFDLSAAIAASGPERILLTEQFPAIDATWQVLVEDYTSPAGTSEFIIGEVSATEDVAQWPVTSAAGADPAAPSTRSPAENGQDEALLAHIEAGPAGLFLKFSGTASPELIDRFRFCMLVFRKVTAQHRIQLRTRDRIAPLGLGLEKAKVTVPLDGLPAATMVAHDRLTLEIQRVDIGQVPSPTVSLRGAVNKEVIVPLDRELECEMGITLSDADGRYDLVLMPRYMVNDRRQQLVPVEVKKDLARAQSQLTKNQRQLREAQLNLEALPREINHVRGLHPSSPQEAAAQDVRLGQLERMGASLQSKVSRLSEAEVKLATTAERAGLVLALLDQLSSQSALHFRVIAQGEMGDLVLVQASSDY